MKKELVITENDLKNTENKVTKVKKIYDLIKKSQAQIIYLRKIDLDSTLLLNDEHYSIFVQNCSISCLIIQSMNVTIDNSKINRLGIINSDCTCIYNSNIQKLELMRCVHYFCRKHSSINKIHILDCSFEFCEHNEEIGFYDEKEIDTVVKYSGACNLLSVCPEEGSFIGFKKAYARNNNGSIEEVIVKLRILDDSLRSSSFTRKCRANHVKVLDIYSVNNKQNKYTTAYSMTYDYCSECSDNECDSICSECDWDTNKIELNFKYEKGETIFIDNFCEDRWEECAPGIHFFITEKEARDYID